MSVILVIAFVSIPVAVTFALTPPVATKVIMSAPPSVNPVPAPMPIPVLPAPFSPGASMKLLYIQRAANALVSSVDPAPPVLPNVLLAWKVLSLYAAISPTLIAPPVFIVGLDVPLAVSIVPCPGVANVSVAPDSLNTLYVLTPPIINDVACKLPSFLRFAILVFVLSYEISDIAYAPAPVLTSTSPGSPTIIPLEK